MLSVSPQERLAEREFVYRACSAPFKVGTEVYLVPAIWFHSWKSYASVSHAPAPGPITTARLREANGSLKRGMVKGKHYVILPQVVWDTLSRRYGAQNPVLRRVIRSVHPHRAQVEVYPMYLQLVHLEKLIPIKPISISRASKVSFLLSRASAMLSIPPHQCYLYYDKDGKGDWRRVERRNYVDPIDSLRLPNGVRICVTGDPTINIRDVVTSRNAEAGDDDITEDSMDESDDEMELTIFNTSHYSSHHHNSSSSSSASTSGTSAEKGLTGLANMGNTCFMNSALQCLSNAPSLTSYFLRGEDVKDINRSNPLGMTGDLAERYSNLMKLIWDKGVGTIVPRGLKFIIGRFAPQFSGYRQHDSQELLAFLLDGLHEDLNRVRDKPATEKVEAHGRLDNVVAKETWEVHLRRNQSIIVDVFQGLLKSCVTCPDPSCKYSSITFDPFMYLSLPIPTSGHKVVRVVYQSSDLKEIPVEYKLHIEGGKTILDLKRKLISQLLSGTLAENIVISTCEVTDKKISTIKLDHDPCSELSSSETLFAFDLGIPEESDYSIPVKFSHAEEKAIVFGGFGDPFVARLLVKTSPGSPSVTRGEDDMEVDEVSGSGRNCTVSVDSVVQQLAAMLSLDIDVVTQLSISVNQMSDVRLSDEEEFLIEPLSDIIVKWPTQTMFEKYMGEVKGKQPRDGGTPQVKNGAGNVTLQDCLAAFTFPETLGEGDEWFCPQCSSHQRAKKKIDIWKLPKILVVHLKRFLYTRLARQKIGTEVSFPLKNLDIAEFMPKGSIESGVSTTYNLFAVTDHSGGLGGGHYTAFARNHKTQKWYLYNDANVHEVPASRACSKGAYLLFYERV
eukprot:TRINITY_DN1123_c2_g7_i1.p1 TRINITY_DN1123_c2_g7~~TRINITY_DN1123_c2_g7_i1.p1  ORF type:complete len:844 (-),score=142.52 TRINITY_DN1123_c2_g7_i1:150-2681(-)